MVRDSLRHTNTLLVRLDWPGLAGAVRVKSFLECAIDLAVLGFEVFPVKAHSKKPPMVKEFWLRASKHPEELRQLWKYDPVMGVGESYNPAISTTGFGFGALIVIDVDPKHGGDDSLEFLQIVKGCILPDTYEQRSPSGGTHLVYWIPVACAGSQGELAPGLDIRSHHNYIVGAGGETDAGVYTSTIRPVAEAPDWLKEWALAHPAAPERAARRADPVTGDRRIALRRAHDYLQGLAPAPDGQRDALAYRAAAHLKTDVGLSEADAAEQMQLWWRHDGVFNPEEIAHAVQSAYKYSQGEQGEASPERYFAPVPEVPAPEQPSPVKDDPSPEDAPTSGDLRTLLNRDHAFIMVGNKARVMWERKDHEGRLTREFLAIQDFKDKNAGDLMDPPPGSKKKDKVEVAAAWLRWKHRRSFDGLVFAPGKTLSGRFYNTWRGFAYEPLARGEKPTDGMRESLDMFKVHIRENLCVGNVGHAKWLMAFFAHMIQKPAVKPLVALVFKGGKGNGKSAAVQRVGALVEPHLFVASNQRFLLGNFNSHMSDTLFFVLEEALWGGSKSAEGMLKDIVTNGKLNIEQKFREAFRADNYMRVAIVGNEEWQVPASLKDERRWAVFNVEMRSMPFETIADKKKIRAFFYRMRVLMEEGGYRYLLTYLQGLDLEGADVDEAPMTEGLIEQIEHTLSPLHQWWYECLRDGRIVGGDFLGGWPRDPEKRRMYAAFCRYCEDRRIDSRRLSSIAFGKELHRVCPSMQLDKKKRAGDDQVWIYGLPPLPTARTEWADTIGRAPVWPDEEDF